MNVLPDSNVWIDLLRPDRVEAATARLRALSAGLPLVMSSVVRFELEVGVVGRRDEEGRRRAFNALLEGPISQAFFDTSAAHAAATISAMARTQGRALGATDAMIAGHAKALGLKLLTADARLLSTLPSSDAVAWPP